MLRPPGASTKTCENVEACADRPGSRTTFSRMERSGIEDDLLQSRHANKSISTARLSGPRLDSTKIGTFVVEEKSEEQCNIISQTLIELLRKEVDIVEPALSHRGQRRRRKRLPSLDVDDCNAFQAF